MANIIAIANQKGGVSKTTSAVNLGAALCMRGRRVLVVDFDPTQASATYWLGYDGVTPSMYEVFTEDVAMASVIVEHDSGVSLAVGSKSLITIDDVGKLPINALAAALATVKSDYDYILIDCGPSLSQATRMALFAADWVLIPLQLSTLALEGMSSLFATIESMRASNPTLTVAGVFATMVDQRGTNVSNNIYAAANEMLGGLLMETEIPLLSVYGESVEAETSIFGHNGRKAAGKAREAYRQLARELEERIGN